MDGGAPTREKIRPGRQEKWRATLEGTRVGVIWREVSRWWISKGRAPACIGTVLLHPCLSSSSSILTTSPQLRLGGWVCNTGCHGAREAEARQGVASNILKRSRVCCEQRLSASARGAEGLADS